MIRKYPIGIQSFEKLRTEGYRYVDKTAYIKQLVDEGSYYFLSRPRRFGKSLLLSTIHAFFDGKKKLFKGLEIDATQTEWKEYPVFHIDFNATDFTRDESLFNLIDNKLREWESFYDVQPVVDDVAIRFANLIVKAYRTTGCQVVILIDEYDKPLLVNLFHTRRQERFRNLLKGFYGVLKTCDREIRFAMLTGVTKFGKVSVFSDLNNLNDISLDSRYNAICGISESELSVGFKEDIHALAESLATTDELMRAELKATYDGYHFCTPSDKGVEGVYNPFSLFSAFQKLKIEDYWFATGTPSMLIELLRKTNYPIPKLDGAERRTNDLMGLETALKDPIPVIYQSGYLTITGYDVRTRRYTLGYPNREVKRAWLEDLLPLYANPNLNKTDFDIYAFIADVEAGNVDAFLQRLKSFMANIPYDHSSPDVSEGRLHDIVYTVAALIGYDLRTEYHTSTGRIDMVIHTSDITYVFEFKLDHSAEVASAQIFDRQYVMPFSAPGNKVIAVGVNFSSKTRNITDWKVF